MYVIFQADELRICTYLDCVYFDDICVLFSDVCN